MELPSKKNNAARILALHKRGILATVRANAEIGEMIFDGTIYAGRSPTTGKRMFVAPKDAPLSKTFNEATEYAASLEVGGQTGFRLPDKAELKVIFENRDKGALKNTFKKTNIGSSAWYCSSTPSGFNMIWIQQFISGIQTTDTRDKRTSVRCLRP